MNDDRPSPETELTGTQWRHLKRGTSYEVVGVAKLQTALTEGLADETPMVVYRNVATNKLSVRSLDEFCDGRFEKLGRATPAQGRPNIELIEEALIRNVLRSIDPGGWLVSVPRPDREGQP